jgi:hypothetical protein
MNGVQNPRAGPGFRAFGLEFESEHASIVGRAAGGGPQLVLNHDWGSRKRDFYFHIAAGCGCVHGGDHPIDESAQDGPLSISESPQ